jgi:hypothetical protein
MRSPNAHLLESDATKLRGRPLVGHPFVGRAGNPPPVLIPVVAAFPRDGRDLIDECLDAKAVEVRISDVAGRIGPSQKLVVGEPVGWEVRAARQIGRRVGQTPSVIGARDGRDAWDCDATVVDSNPVVTAIPSAIRIQSLMANTPSSERAFGAKEDHHLIDFRRAGLKPARYFQLCTLTTIDRRH